MPDFITSENFFQIIYPLSIENFGYLIGFLLADFTINILFQLI